MSGVLVALNGLRRTVSFVQVRPTFDPNPPFDYIKVEPIPTCQSCNTRSGKLAQWVKVDPPNTDNENNDKAKYSGIGQDSEVR